VRRPLSAGMMAEEPKLKTTRCGSAC